ncbi:MAG TPA: DNA-binding protein [Actinophytocola sp.]|uniref:DNA-binding protein n=1 Tax=Actinophytocola sp. TaxID=1872138 RepID=UPI002DDCA976|nr:DNA-binding protein [Actinophytocola sp.]HEV2777888.1 DNA-binding protein [Actinophytocola sp.]
MPTLDEIRRWPATVDVVQAGRAIGLGRNGAYEAVKQDRFPVRVLKIGNRLRVVTAELVALLEAVPSSSATTDPAA